MTHKEYDIVISYRRVGGADKARILKTELEARGYKVFLDFDELKDGVFDKRIMDAIDSSPIFMFLLTPNSLERCLNDDDWVRKEIEYAVDNHKHFIPINPDCTFTSLPAGLSAKVMAGLGQHQFSDVMFGQLFKASINELISDRIRPVLASGDVLLPHLQKVLSCASRLTWIVVFCASARRLVWRRVTTLQRLNFLRVSINCSSLAWRIVSIAMSVCYRSKILNTKIISR